MDMNRTRPSAPEVRDPAAMSPTTRARPRRCHRAVAPTTRSGRTAAAGAASSTRHCRCRGRAARPAAGRIDAGRSARTTASRGSSWMRCASRPWREVVPAPAWRNMDARTLARALALGEDIRSGRADLWALDAASLALRGRRPKARARSGHAGESQLRDPRGRRIDAGALHPAMLGHRPEDPERASPTGALASSGEGGRCTAPAQGYSSVAPGSSGRRRRMTIDERTPQ